MTCAEKLGKNNEEFIADWYDCNRNCSWKHNIKNNAILYAAMNGHFECLKYCT
jgi:hypothetical protein